MPQPSLPPDEAQRITIQSYDTHNAEYDHKSKHDNVRTLAYWPGVQFFLDQLPEGQKIFEIGSGTGGDAVRIEAKGFQVQRSDVADAFLKLMRSDSHQPLRYNVLEGPTLEKQAAIFSNAVLLHFTLEQFRLALKHVRESLNPAGLFCVCMKLGNFEGWREKGLSGKRYFKFWQLSDLRKELTDAGFTITNSFVTPKQDFAVITARI